MLKEYVLQGPNVSYAQNREDIILNALLKDQKTGFYVDVGANHPVHESVTKLFYNKGWAGINIEPAQGLWELLGADRPRDINLQVGISNQEGELNFREYLRGDGLSTFSTETQEAYKNSDFYGYYAEEYIDHTVPVTTLAAALAKHAPKKQIDFMKIDVEGYEYEAVEGNDWTKYRPVILCIEANHIVRDWHAILEKAKYHKVFFDGLNEYFVAEEHRDLVKDFSYADSVFLGKQFVGWREEKQSIALRRAERQARYELVQTNRQLEKSNSPAAALPATFKSFIKYSIKQTARGYEHYLVQPPRPKITTVSSTETASNQAAADKILQAAAKEGVTMRPALLRRLMSKAYFACKRGAKLVLAKGRS